MNKLIYSTLFFTFTVCVVGRYVERFGKIDGRIVGGTPANIEDYPHQVSLEGIFDEHFCGGSILNAQMILTAGHCVFGANASVLKVRSGTSYKEKGGMLIQAERIDVHPLYQLEGKHDYDAAIVYLSQPLNITISAAPAELVNENEEPAVGSMATVTGWGKTEEGGEGAEQLQKVNVPIVSQEACIEKMHMEAVTARMICAGYLGVGKQDACQGDSGGPMLIDGKLSGIVSWGWGCARKDYPGVYTRISAIRDWIDEQIGE